MLSKHSNIENNSLLFVKTMSNIDILCPEQVNAVLIPTAFLMKFIFTKINLANCAQHTNFLVLEIIEKSRFRLSHLFNYNTQNQWF